MHFKKRRKYIVSMYITQGVFCINNKYKSWHILLISLSGVNITAVSLLNSMNLVKSWGSCYGRLIGAPTINWRIRCHQSVCPQIRVETKVREYFTITERAFFSWIRLTPCWKWQISCFQPAPTSIAPCSCAQATRLLYWANKRRNR